MGANSSILDPLLSLPGSLAVSVADMTAPAVGSSGGVYALVSAHLANIVMVSASSPTCLFWFPCHHWGPVLTYQSWVLGPWPLSS